MIRISIIGSGNVAQHLITAFDDSTTIEVVQIYSRNNSTLAFKNKKTQIISNYKDLTEADVYIIAVSDDAIIEVSAALPFTDRLVVHTSGTAALNAINSRNRAGVFYPLQTFTKGKDINFSTIPMCIEATTEADESLLKKVAQSVSNAVYDIQSEQRKVLHVAAVFVNNFTNHLYKIGEDICTEHNLPFKILQPIIQETAEKIKDLSPIQAQTGPAKREDYGTITAHAQLLKDENQKKIYNLLTQSIIHNGKKL